MIIGQQIPDGDVIWEVAKFYEQPVEKEEEPEDTTADTYTSEYLLNQINNVREILTNMIGARQDKTEYTVGSIASYPSESIISLECITAGITAENTPFIEKDEIGTIVQDGSVKWLVLDVRDGTPVGGLRYALYVPPGYVIANGSTVTRADYPRLVKIANKHNLWTDNPSLYPGLFGIGNNSTTMTLPDLRTLFIQSSETAAGSKINAGLPNIIGTINNSYGNFSSGSGANSVAGSATKGGNANLSITNGSTLNVDVSSATGYATINFNASNSNNIYGKSTTVQPPAVTMLPIIRY